MRTYGLGALAATLLLASGVPARAADNLDCALALADHKTSSEIFVAYRADRNIGEALVAAQGAGLWACVERHGWTEQALESAVRVILGEALGFGLTVELQRTPLDPRALAPAIDDFLARNPAEQPKFADGDVSSEAIAGLIASLEKSGVLGGVTLTEQLGHLIGEFASARANSIYFRRMFTEQ